MARLVKLLEMTFPNGDVKKTYQTFTAVAAATNGAGSGQKYDWRWAPWPDHL
jgi:hypothetical protein